jgi:hypothetical protein
MKRLITIVALGLIGVATVTAAPLGAQSGAAAKACKDQRTTIGMAAFRLLYAPAGKPKAALDACLVQQVQVASTEAKNAAMECKAERGTTADARTAFAEKYGTNPNKKNAFGKCVSQKTSEGVAEQQEAVLSAAKACKEERGTSSTSRSAFAEKYGTNAKKTNAFGKCVKAMSASG